MVSETQPLRTILRSVGESTTLKLPLVPTSNQRRPFWPTVTTTAVAVTCLGAAVGLPMLRSLQNTDRFSMPPAPPGSTQTHEPSPPDTPTISVPSSQNPVEQPQINATTPVPIYVPSVCETQAGTQEGQLTTGLPVLPATMDRPSIFVVSPDRSSDQSFSVRPAGASDADWQTVSLGDDVGIVGILTRDTQFRTGNGQAVWGKSCEPTSVDAVKEAENRMDDLCRRREFGFETVVVFHVGPDGKPVEMNRIDC